MVNGKEQLMGESDVPYRRRGRPAGKNRVPLSREERRARNAQYERERRNETAEVMSQLAEAVGCDPNISNADLLATVISRIQNATRKKSSEDIADLERINANLESQIASLQSRLGLDEASFELLNSESNELESVSPRSRTESVTDNNCKEEDRNVRMTQKRKRSERSRSSEYIHLNKRTKTQSEVWTETDSSIELRSHAVSPPKFSDQHGMQCLIQSEQLQQVPKEITEEQDHDVSQAHAELQAELYNQIYNSESQSSEESIPEWNVGTMSSNSFPCMEALCRSLIVVPSIISPQQDPPDSRQENQIQPDSNIVDVEAPCDLENESICDILPQEQTILDILTDTEKGLVSDWIGGEFLDASGFNNEVQSQNNNYSSGDFLSMY